MPRTTTLLLLFIASSVFGFGEQALDPEMIIPAESMEPRQDLYYLDESFDGPDFPPAGWIAQSTHPSGSYE